ncbi:hypothetical protein F4806DRAFT_496713 [Annulohypoxylon nitens]|nr:hypothetical protein F4806DRAFT_496713 [Annulohypoxylon nitens]
MCVLTSLLCPQCGVTDDYGIRICNNTKQICCEQAQGLENYNNSDFITRCPDFLWPPNQLMPVVKQTCDECTLKNNSDDEVPTLTCPKVRGARLNGEEDVKEWEEWSEKHNHWAARLSEIPHRRLTLRIPCCDLCKKSTFFRRKILTYEEAVAEPILGIEGIEFEFNSILWKWLCLTNGKQALATRLLTGFLAKPCATCIKKESRMRNEHADIWRVAPIFKPTTIPYLPKKHPFMRTMSIEWKSRTGAAFEDIALYDHGGVILPFTPHKTPFVTLSQWNDLLGIRGHAVSTSTTENPPYPFDCEGLYIGFDTDSETPGDHRGSRDREFNSNSSLE